MRRTELTVEQILQWADAYHERTGKWPQKDSGRIWEPPDEKWANIDMALRKGLRGLPRGGSLARLLAKHRGVRNRKALPSYNATQILKWADDFRVRKGRWPRPDDGDIPETNGETWFAVEMALAHGQRGMPGGSSLARLLAAKRGRRNIGSLPRLSVSQILGWADDYKRRTSTWPTHYSGPIPGTNETWITVDKALRKGSRGLRRSSLARLLHAHRGVPLGELRRPPLNIKQILAWGDEYHACTGSWPTTVSGPIEGTRETWNGVHQALCKGTRGLPGGMSLAQLWNTHRGARIHVALPPLTEEQIVRWIKAYQRKHGRLPNRDCGPIEDSRGETWCGVVMALRKPARGLKRRTTLKKLLDAHD